MKSEVKELTEFTIEIAHQAGKLALSMFGRVKSSIKEDKTPVTEADHIIQEMIIEEIRKKFPEHNIIAEESSADVGWNDSSKFVWVIDPIDGTRNFSRRIPVFTISIACLYEDKIILGVIREPNFDWTFWADVENRTKFNGNDVRVSGGRFCRHSVIGVTVDNNTPAPSGVHRLMDSAVLRNYGSVALHFAMASCGMLDGLVNFAAKLWDISAGIIILKQAGGIVIPINNTYLIPTNLKTYTNQPIKCYAGNENIVQNLSTLLFGR